LFALLLFFIKNQSKSRNKTKAQYMKRFEKHIFVCENKRPDGHPRGCCMDKGGALVREKFKKRLKELGLSHEARANASGCLDACEFGVTVLVYPEQVWYGGVTVDDVEEIIQSHIINNKPVERLFIKDERFHKDAGAKSEAIS
jgi:(2Fe-2S) ferredoxin